MRSRHEESNDGGGWRDGPVASGRGGGAGANIASGRQIWHTTHFAEGSTFRSDIASVSFYGRVVLDGDCTFDGVSNPLIQPDCVLDMNGHTLTAKKGFYSFNPKEVLNPGRIEVVSQNSNFIVPQKFVPHNHTVFWYNTYEPLDGLQTTREPLAMRSGAGRKIGSCIFKDGT